MDGCLSPKKLEFENMFGFFRSIHDVLVSMDSLSDIEQEKLLFYLQFTQLVDNMSFKIENNRIVFTAHTSTGDSTENFIIEDIERFVCVYISFEKTQHINNIDFLVNIYKKLELMKDLLCSHNEILDTVKSYKFITMGCTFDIVEKAMRRGTIGKLYRILSETLIFNQMGFSYNEIHKVEPRGIRDIRVTIGHNERIYTYDLPLVNIFKGFNSIVKCKDNCLICYEEVDELVVCGNCKKGVCETCYKSIRSKHCCFCFYNIHTHILEKVKQLDIQDLVFKVHEIII